MPTLIWTAPMRYYSLKDESVFFDWLKSIPCVVDVHGEGHQLKIHLKSKRISEACLRELLALYKRFKGNFRELAQFETPANSTWFRNPKAFWYKGVFSDDGTA